MKNNLKNNFEERGEGKFLCITVSFLSQRYHGVEWPPSPSRVFQALLCSARTGSNLLSWPKYRGALEWLETLELPRIFAPPGKRGPKYKQFGPLNDLDELAKKGDLSPPKIAEHLKPIHAIWPRTEISEWKIEGNVHYVWKAGENEIEKAKVICELADNLFVLGRGVDHVIGWGRILTGAEIQNLEGTEWIPDVRGDVRLQVPYRGFLAQLLENFPPIFIGVQDSRSCVRLRRPNKKEEGYRQRLGSPLYDFSCFHLDKSFRWEDVMLVAAWMRHAVSERFEELGRPKEWINMYVLGHGTKEHMRFVPLPSIGHPHSDGRIRRAMIVYRKGERIEDEDLSGLQLKDKDGNLRATMTLAKWRDDKVFPCYLTRSNVWITTTPLILHGYDCRHKKFSPLKAQKLILQALSESGLSPAFVKNLWFQKSPLWRGTAHVRNIRVPNHLSNRPRYHVRIELTDALWGPVLAGIGQHYGLGLFASPDQAQV